MVVLFKQKTTISKGASNTNAVRTSVPATIAKMLDVKAGDKIEWTVESTNDEISISITKVE